MSEPINNQSALPVGAKLLHYRISGELGRGGFGLTYKAEDLKLNRPVVIKEYLPQDLAGRRQNYTVGPLSDSTAESFQAGLDSFLKKAQTLAKFQHPNIVPILGFFKSKGGTAFIVMPFMEGQTLADRLAQKPGGRMSEAEVLVWLNPLLDGLQTIHAAGFLHRDIKPDNIFLQTSGNPILIDFGAARNALANRSRSLSVVLTPGYAPMEQYTAAAANQGPWTDLYALGAVILRCLTGAAPPDSTERQDAVTNGEPDPLKAQLRALERAAVSPRLAQAVAGCLRLARKDRLQGVAELRQVLDNRLAPKPENIKPTPPVASAAVTPAPPVPKVEIPEEPAAPKEVDPVAIPTTPERVTSAQTYTNSIGMKFVLIPAGMFVMGSPPDDKSAFDWEKPAHQVTISRPFYLGKYEVTQAQWEEVMGSNPSYFKGWNNPVENVSWDDVQVFIQKLNQKEGTNKYRLPTEAEWEYAARAGSQTRYYFGDSEGKLGEYAYYGDNSGKETHPVGQKKPNGWGLYDMAGNVWEWVEDWFDFDYYSQSPATETPRGLLNEAATGSTGAAVGTTPP